MAIENPPFMNDFTIYNYHDYQLKYNNKGYELSITFIIIIMPITYIYNYMSFIIPIYNKGFPSHQTSSPDESKNPSTVLALYFTCVRELAQAP